MSKKSNKILLDVGTNEVEILSFTLGESIYGINVAKVKEVVPACPVEQVPGDNKVIYGVFKQRDEVITVIDLCQYLGIKPKYEHNNREIFLITNFNQFTIAFRVETVIDINRISWRDIRKPDLHTYCSNDVVVTGIITNTYDKIISIIDFEKILFDILPETAMTTDKIEEFKGRDPRKSKLLIVEDSPLLMKVITECLTEVGYNNFHTCGDGEEAYNYLMDNVNNLDINCVITDIEMPKMDGHRLTKLIKEDEKLRHLPVVIFSSLVSPHIYQKGFEVGADEQLSKPDIRNLVQMLDSILQEN